MELAAIINQYYDVFISKYAGSLLPGHLKAMNAICSCRTPDSGELYVHCPNCNHGQWHPLSCGHRSCPQCQNHEASQGLTGNRESCYRFPILWLRLRCRMNCGL